MPLIISPSVLTADFGNLSSEIAMLNRSEAEWIHLDIMDGVFVPNISFGFPVVKYVSQNTQKIVDTHLMIVDPDRYLERFKDAGVDVLTVQAEACTHLNRTVNNIRELGMKAGVALNPATPLCVVEEILDYVDMILVMSVNPGFGGQTFIPSTFDKIKRLHQMIEKRGADVLIQVDGGVSENNAAQLRKAGCDVLVVGNAVFGSSDPEKTISNLVKA